MNTLVLWLAQGFGLGRLPFAPGTFGSLGGLVWFGLLLSTGTPFIYVSGLLLGIALSVWIGARAEEILGKIDPGSVVMDEIVAVPICISGWVAWVFYQSGELPGPMDFVVPPNCLLTLGIFAAFRFFEILKPLPVRQSQSLSGGWGITADDVLAAIYVNICVGIFFAAKSLLGFETS